MPNHNPNFKEYTWKPGQSGNPNGRPARSRNRRDAELADELKARGDIDSAVFLSSVVTNNDNSWNGDQRIHAAGLLLPYQHAKVSSIPALVFTVEPVELPHPSPASTQEVFSNIAHIDQLFTSGPRPRVLQRAEGYSAEVPQRVDR
jgi:hypothetical protein